MIFSTTFFLFCYLPVVLLLYYIAPLKLRNLVLLLVSLIFYAWGEPVYILIMLLSILIDYTHGILVAHFKREGAASKAKAAVASSVIFNLLLLFFFKYWDFIAGTLAAAGAGFMPILGLELPIGISFFTFQTMSYTIDVYREETGVQKNPVTFGAFVVMFPQLIAGPIIKYKEVAKQLETRTYGFERFASGITRFVCGLCKKVLLANNFGLLWETFYDMNANDLTALGSWLGIAAFSLQLYFDFSGYSDMAIGLGRMLGFEFPENFNYPYIAKSVTDFWRRWHISLTTWFRDYLYIPLGGNRKGKANTIRNLMLVWLATGIWHGASWNFVAWGAYYFLLIVLEREFLSKVLKKMPAVFLHVYVMLVVMIGWAVFAVEDFKQLGSYLKVMFGIGTALYDNVFIYQCKGYAILFIIGIFAATPAGSAVWKKLPVGFCRVAGPVLMLTGLLLSAAYLIDGSYNPFIYFRF